MLSNNHPWCINGTGALIRKPDINAFIGNPVMNYSCVMITRKALGALDPGIITPLPLPPTG